MIKELFLPEKIGSKRIRSIRTLGLSITHKEIAGVLVHATSSHTFLEQAITIPLSTKPGEEKTVVKALQEIVKKVKKRYDTISITIPSSMAIFKELQVPFTNHEKISMILDFEIEGMLPFSIHDSVADFIITHESKKGAQVLVSAMRKQDLQAMLDPYHEAGIAPDIATIDLLALYNTYQQIPEYKTLRNGCALIDLGYESTRIALLDAGQLRLTRHIQQGMHDIALNISKELDLSIEKSLEQLFSLDMTNSGSSSFAHTAQKHFMSLFNDIQFTLNSFSLKLKNELGVEKILFVGSGTSIAHMIPFCNHFLQIPCEIFDAQKLIAHGIIKNKTPEKDIRLDSYLFALGAVLPTPTTEFFNLRRKDFTKDYTAILRRQLITAGIILGMIFGALAFRGYMEISELAHAANELEKKEINKLKKIIPNNELPKTLTLQKLVTQGEKVIQKRINLWAPFTDDYITPLEILEDLTKVIDKKMFDIKISSITISTNQGSPNVGLEGFFKSLTGKDNYAYFSQFKSRFEGSSLLELDGDFDERPQEEQGIPFSAKLKPRTTI